MLQNGVIPEDRSNQQQRNLQADPTDSCRTGHSDEYQNDPKNCQVHWKLGDILLEQQAEPQAALSEENKALELCPNSVEAHEDRGRALLKLERYEDAAKDLRLVAAADPGVARPHFLLAQAYRGLGRSQEAQAEMQMFGKLEADAQAAKANRAKQILQNKESAPTP